MLELIHKAVWGPWLMVLFLGVGTLYTVRSGFFQLRGLKVWWQATAGSFGKTGKEQVKTACTALAATVGTGNITGVATAVAAGGPGALFWMWVSAAAGMMTAYGEVYLGIQSRYALSEGGIACGPYVYLERMAGQRGLSLVYAFLCVVGSLGMGSMVQANSLAETVSYSFGIPAAAAAAFLCLAAGLVIGGGRKRIGEAAAGLIPFSAGLYMAFSIAVLILCREQLPDAVRSVFREAFTLPAALGGAAGSGISGAVRYGLARGVFSNEAGLGSMAILHGDSPGQDARLQGMWAMFEVFFDTIVVCTLTGLVILCCGGGGEPAPEGAALASWCFQKHLGNAGGYAVSLSMILFAFATIIAWYYLGSQALLFLIGRLGWKNGKNAAALYRFLYLGAVCMGCVAAMEKVWLFSDIVNGLLSLPNLLALVLLVRRVEFPGRFPADSPPARGETKKRPAKDAGESFFRISENGVFWIAVFLGAVQLLFL
ncbi:MAG TPA: sodium:alanine symporter family protein [Candidatus Caccovicinus merdipullorum]|uniref:Sodium:alanine symporter family protein n=1 Tax=Candidatus Caccovicinus merdipullorum TaxID=2840724 RepID=A0A9D1KGC0_9FIRM|nr:sodium:alanine symporter family protein [Candidatus Caccovicinus merdipullorum]